MKVLLLALVVPFLFASCASQKKAKGVVTYTPGRKTATMVGQTASPPKRAPKAVKLAIAAGNRLTNKPYKWGGGHARLNDSGYDCSGAVSFVLREAGLLNGQMPSRGFFKYGKKGYGKWITVYVRNGHVFLTVAGLRFDTGGSRDGVGPRWKPSPRNASGHIVRHPAGL